MRYVIRAVYAPLYEGIFMSVILPEFVAMQAVADAVANLTPLETRRVAAWLLEYANQKDDVESTILPSTEDDLFAATTSREFDVVEQPATPEPLSSIVALYDAVAPRTGAQKAVVAGYWLQKHQEQDFWKAGEVNRLLKSIDVRVSSISIVLTNAVKATQPLIKELGRLGEGQRSRKTFCLTEAGISYVEGRLG